MKSTSCSGDLKGVYVGGGGCSKCDKWENVSYPIYGYVTRECYYIGCNHTWHDDEGSTTDYSSIQPYQAIKSVDVILIQ
ncbi:hypothetical protein [Butyrivibrio proteoclasticus]|uniref:hypothetical protein n=1 Tax=Butyrivibrio proteoclasticus TaxID=43305 RepID=UPI0012DF0FE8|nr:hypothetical protein [Butyrivibrio proteoclasticus]